MRTVRRQGISPHRRARAVLLLLAVGLGWMLSPAIAFSQALPADVSTRVGRAGEFVYNYTPQQYATRLGERDVFWNNAPPRGVSAVHLPAGVFSGAYTPVNRVPVAAWRIGAKSIITACGDPRGSGCTLEWFHRNHPRWIIYKADQVTPAYQYDNKNWIPLDVSNSEVQSWIKANVFAPLLDLGYQALSVDNVTAQNDYGETGVCSIAPRTNCTADGGVWTQIYSGRRQDDQRYMNARIEWAKVITAYAHSRGASTIGNVTYAPALPAATAALINAFDLWLDEPGFLGSAVPSMCSLDPRYASSGKKWEEKVNFITKLNGGRGPKGYIILSSICPFDSPSQGAAFDMVEMAVASYMIVKNAHAYILMYFTNGKDCGAGAYCDDRAGAAWPQDHLEHGMAEGPFSVRGGVYHRAFSKALALVNPSPAALPYDLGTGVYYRSDCSKWSGHINVPRQSGMVLLRDAPATCRGR